MKTTRTHKEVTEADPDRRRAFVVAVLADLAALERMLAEGRFETGVRRIGAEQEMFLVDGSWAPAKAALSVMQHLADPHFTTELGLFQLEANCDPQVLTGRGLSAMHAQLDGLVEQARAASRAQGLDVVLTGILPTLRRSDLGLDSMVPSPRYLALNRVLTELRGGTFEFSISGLDELTLNHDSVMLEACNSSFQVHYQVAPDEFARLYNIAQLLAGPIMSVSANSPLAFNQRLWAETRIALFRQAVDTRTQTRKGRTTEARVSFGTRWVQGSVTEIHREDIARFRTLIGGDLDEDPAAVLDRGETPQLKALRLHNGTIYRWNRPCYGILDGKPHLRIENRVMPSGPSVLDQMANAAFWFGLMSDFGAREDAVPERMDFDQAGHNFYTAAQQGLGAHFVWLDGREVSAQRLVLDDLLPRAEAGLRSEGVGAEDITHYLGVIDQRCRLGRTGARWQLSSWNGLRDRATPGERANALVAATIKRQVSGRPVAEWERARLDEARGTSRNYKRVEQFMRTDLYTVDAEDPIAVVSHLMIWERIRYVMVEDKDHALLGVVSFRAVLRHLAAGRDLERTPVSAIMLAEPTTVHPEASALEAIQLMRWMRIGSLPVVREGRLVGLVLKDDFLAVAEKLLEEEAERGG
jgi:CBS domain-containing protein